jgi:hypothetical protein
LATPAGFEPATTRLEGECSIQLSYGVADNWSSEPTGTIDNCPGQTPARSEADPVVPEIVGVSFRLLDAVMGFDDSVVEAVFLGKGHRPLERWKA